MNLFCEPCGDEFAKIALTQMRHLKAIESVQIDELVIGEKGEGYATLITTISVKLPVTVWGTVTNRQWADTCLKCGNRID